MTTVTVTISGRQFRLRCDDEQRTVRAAAEVETILELLRRDSADQSTPTLAMLAALNLAERNDALIEQRDAIVGYVSEQLRAMGAYLEEAMQRAVEATT
ncbi:MAG: cell division protein ZapA [Chlorobi bacterium]|jgi:cell division protein ZapA (FtsZ GTPase activity inhibitor)|nr:cell division protein ZapA [Chlorobiota bacterium]